MKCLMLSGLLKRPWLRAKVRFGLVTLTKPDHSTSKPIDDPCEVRLAKSRPHGLKDIHGHVFEVDFCAGARAVELFEGVANLAHRSIKLFLRHFGCYWPYDPPSQIRHFGLQIEGCIHFVRSLPMCGMLPSPVLIRLALTALWLPPPPAHSPATLLPASHAR